MEEGEHLQDYCMTPGKDHGNQGLGKYSWISTRHSSLETLHSPALAWATCLGHYD